jgi:predicted transposase/invertase (TIGR01784 family)
LYRLYLTQQTTTQMLGNLDNEVIFKKAFTDKIVFKAFVRDILGIEVEVDTIETEKKFNPKIGYVDFEIDIFAETTDKRIAIEIQRVEYDIHFDRFLHYFFMLIAEQQKNAKAYNIEQTVYVIVVLTAPYTISEKNGKPVLDEVLLLNLNPKTIKGTERDLYGHQFVCLNPNHPEQDTPRQIRDWLDLIYQSIHNPQRPALNTDNEGIKKAIELISFENLTPEERRDAKNKEASKMVIATVENAKAIEIAKKLLTLNLSDEDIAQATDLSIDQIKALKNKIA